MNPTSSGVVSMDVDPFSWGVVSSATFWLPKPLMAAGNGGGAMDIMRGKGGQERIRGTKKEQQQWQHRRRRTDRHAPLKLEDVDCNHVITLNRLLEIF